jgi:hypothetical protein
LTKSPEFAVQEADLGLRHLNQVQLSRRWALSIRTLERWRWKRTGPSYIKVGGRVLYRLEDILAYEASGLRQLQSVIVGRPGSAGGRR